MKTQPAPSGVFGSICCGPVIFEGLRKILNYRPLMWQPERRDILKPYKRSVVGVAWTMLNPLAI